MQISSNPTSALNIRESREFSRLKGNPGEHDCDVRFYTGSGNTAFRACAMHPAIIIDTVRSLWTWLWGIAHSTERIFGFFFICRILAVFVFANILRGK